MSAVMERPVTVGVKQSQPTLNQKTLERLSAVTWVIQFFRDINFMGPLGVQIRNSIDREDPDEQGRVFLGMRRCIPYPLVNHEYNVPPHEQVDNDLPLSYGNSAPGVAYPLSPIRAPKYARICAEEIVDMYGKEYGAVILEPLTGIHDASIVEEIFMAVQPETFALHKLEHELTVGASQRIAEMPDRPVYVNGETKMLSQLAEECRRVMIGRGGDNPSGLMAALQNAQNRYGDFDRDARSYLATKQGRHTPNDYDVFIAEQLGREVPTIVQQPATQDNSAINLLAEKLVEATTPRTDETTAQKLSQLEAEREADRQKMDALMQMVAEMKANQSVTEIPESVPVEDAPVEEQPQTRGRGRGKAVEE